MVPTLHLMPWDVFAIDLKKNLLKRIANYRGYREIHRVTRKAITSQNGHAAAIF